MKFYSLKIMGWVVLGVDVKTECESGLRQKRCGLMGLFAMCAQFLSLVVMKVWVECMFYEQKVLL
jgi:hypothetical protein